MADRPNILIVFTSWSGNTRALAEAIAEGAKGAGNGNVDVTVKRARDTRRSDIESASAVAFGSPTYYSYMSGELKALFDIASRSKTRFTESPPSPSRRERAGSSSASRASRASSSSSR